MDSKLTRERVVQLLREKIAELECPELHVYGSPEFRRWRIEVGAILRSVFGDKSQQLKNFRDASIVLYPVYRTDDLESQRERAQPAHEKMLPHAKAALEAIIFEVETVGIPALGRGTKEKPKAFIAHGGQSARLRRLCDFLEALGVEPIVAEWRASEGRWVEEHVDKRMGDSDCDIVLAEYGGIIDVKTGAKHPRLNVIDELARSRKGRPSKTILLLEKGVELQSNVSGIVYERFTKKNMEQALIKLARELRELGLIEAVKPE